MHTLTRKDLLELIAAIRAYHDCSAATWTGLFDRNGALFLQVGERRWDVERLAAYAVEHVKLARKLTSVNVGEGWLTGVGGPVPPRVLERMPALLRREVERDSPGPKEWQAFSLAPASAAVVSELALETTDDAAMTAAFEEPRTSLMRVVVRVIQRVLER